MKRTGILGLMLLAAAGANAQFSIGNLVVFRVGDGSATLSSAATSVFIDQFTTAGVASGTSVAVTGATVSGTATSEGHLNFVYFGGDTSDVANYGVAFAGYHATAGTAGITGSSSAVIPREGNFVRFDNGNIGSQVSVDLTNGGGNPFSANNIRGVAYNGQTSSFAAVGANGGVWRADNTGAATNVSTTVANNRTVQIAGNDIFFGTGSGATRGIYMIAGGMTGTPLLTATNIMNLGGAASCYDFEIMRDSAGTPVSAIVADDLTTAAGGLYFASGWTGTTFGSPTQIMSATAMSTALGATGLSIRDIVVVGTDIYATTTEASNNRLVKLSFAGGFAGGLTSATTLTTAGTNKVFRGVEMVPEPASMAIMGIGLAGLMARRRRKN